MSQPRSQQAKRPTDKGAGREHVVKVEAGRLLSNGSFEVVRTGSGFVVRPGIVATALHVLLENHEVPASVLDSFRLTFARPRDTTHYQHGIALSWGPTAGGAARHFIKLLKQESELDYALLDFSPCFPQDGRAVQGHLQALTWIPKPLKYGGEWQPQEACQVGGFTAGASRLLGGKVGTHIEEGGRRMVQMQLEQLTGSTGYDPGGYSGGPVIVQDRVIAMAISIDPLKLTEQTQGQDKIVRRAQGGTIFAVPIEALTLPDGSSFVSPQPSDARTEQALLQEKHAANASRPMPPAAKLKQRGQGNIGYAEKVEQHFYQAPAPAEPVSDKPAVLGAEDEDAQKLAEMQATRSKMLKLGLDTRELDESIKDLKRNQREGEPLRPGYVLSCGGHKRFALMSRLGKGGFATVWRALDNRTGKQVAVKVLHGVHAEERSRRERFFRGAREMAKLDHEAIVRVLVPHAEDVGRHYFVMELVEGEDLQRAVLAGRVEREAVLPLIVKVGDAIAAAHQAGLVHRDVKPANILLDTEGRPRLTDFDLVGGQHTTGGTRTSAMGTFLYAAPELLHRPQEADARADVYGLAMTAVFALRGDKLPMGVLRQPERVIDELSCSDALKVVLTRAVALEPAERHADAAAFCEALCSPEQDATSMETAEAGGARREVPGVVVGWLSPAWARQAGSDEYGRWAEMEVKGVVQRMRWIAPGRFLMGSPADEPGRFQDEGPQHEVIIEEGFWLADTPCTQALWEAVMGSNPSRFKSARRPVEQVSAHDVQTFLSKLSKLSAGPALRLPFEAEWEYACRAGSSEATYAGPIEILGKRNAPILDDIAWYGGNSGVDFDLADGRDSSGWPEKQYEHRRASSREVALKRPNAWGLFDMLGNVWEWCADDQRTYAAGSQPLAAPRVAAGERALRGGSWYDDARGVRAAYRGACAPSDALVDVGFRLARGQAAPGP